MKIVIAGAGKVGRTVANELANEGHDLTLIDQSASVLEKVQTQYDVITLQGNSASKAILDAADIEHTDVLIAVTDTDEVNLLSCITAHALNPAIHTIARIRDPEYIEQAYSMRNIFSLSLVVNPERQAAMEIARLLRYPGFLKREAFVKARVEIVELKVKEGSRLANVKLMNLSSVTRAKVLVCVVLRNGEAIMPAGDFVLKTGDRIFVTGEPQQLHSMLTHIGIINMPVKHVIITGGGRISYYLAQELHKANIATSIIEISEKKCINLTEQLPYTTIIHNDVSDRRALDSEDIGDYDAVVSMTGMDELNIVTSLYAHMKNVPQIVTKLGRGEDTDLIANMPIGSIVCPKELCTMLIVRYVRAMQNKKGAALTIHRIADGQVEAIEFTVTETTRHIGETLAKIRLKKNILIVSIGHGSHTDIPDGSSTFKKGDTVVVVAGKGAMIQQLNDIFEEYRI